MSTNSSFYLEKLYPLQNEVLHIVSLLDTGFYLTGGTAVSRAYCHHRFSDDLDLFVNDHPQFTLWGERIVAALTKQAEWQCQVIQKDEQFFRLNLSWQEVWLKIDLVNDVPAHIGEIKNHPELGRVDSVENLIANKLSALIGREEPKDLADIWGLSKLPDLSIEAAIGNAQSKAAGIFPVALARILLSASIADWKTIRWQEPPFVDSYLADLHQLGESLILGHSV
jgi:hypothetical protein